MSKNDDLVIIWAPRRVRDRLKIQAAKKGMSMKDFLTLNFDEENRTISEAERRFKNGLF